MIYSISANKLCLTSVDESDGLIEGDSVPGYSPSDYSPSDYSPSDYSPSELGS
jgi:hypothetical protein